MYNYVFMYSTYQHEHTLVYFHSYFSGGIGSLLLKNLRFRDVYYPQEATGSSEHRSTNNLNDDLRWLSALHNIPEYQRQYASEKLHHHSSGGLLLQALGSCMEGRGFRSCLREAYTNVHYSCVLLVNELINDRCIFFTVMLAIKRFA